MTDEDGKPIAGAVVRCAKVESLVELAKGGMPGPSGWSIPIEAERSTGEDGSYEFAHLRVGARTFFYSAPGRDLAPAIKDLIVVQDGLGAQLNVTLERTTALRVRLGTSALKQATRLHLIPIRWWPELLAASAPRGASLVEFRRVGGPFRKGLIAVEGPVDASPLKIIGRYDLDRSSEVTLSGRETPAVRNDLPEATGLEPWRFEPSTEERLFYSAMSPIPLFWRDSPFGWPSWLPVPAFLRRVSPDPFAIANRTSAPQGKPDSYTLQSSSLASTFARLKSSKPETGVARGFAPHPFLPVLAESRTSGPRLAWTSEASEFELNGLPAGSYRVRALDLFGRVTFAGGVAVRPGWTTTQDVRLWSKVELDEPNSRQVMGFVKWESGLPAGKAVVFMQSSYNFRRYVQRVETDEHGYFRFVDVLGNEPYFVFALPPGDANAMRTFDYFGVGFGQREVWRTLTLHPHRVTGSLIGADSKSMLQLVPVESRDERALWSFSADDDGLFMVSNVPHGRYCVQATSKNRGEPARSSPFEVGDGKEVFVVRWPERTSE